jgi:hypothetical protein
MMSDYLHNVALRMLDALPAGEATLMPGTSIVFPLHINDVDNKEPDSLNYPDADSDITSTERDKHVSITHVFEKTSGISQPAISDTPTYMQPRLQPVEVTRSIEKSEKIINPIEATPEMLSATKHEPEDFHSKKNQRKEVERKHVTEILRTEEAHSIHLTQILRAKEKQQPEIVPPAHILPPESLPVQKIPSQKKLTIGKITVEIVRPLQPQIKTKEKIVTRIVSSPPKESDGTNKLSYGLRQL